MGRGFRRQSDSSPEEQNDYFVPFVMAILVGGLAIATFWTPSESKNPQVQQIVELWDKVESGYPGIERLTLDDKTDTFEFRVPGENQTVQICEGSFESKGKTIQIAGSITCRETVQSEGD